MSYEKFSKELARWMRRLKRACTDEARQQARAATGKIYVKRHVVEAYWRNPAPPRKKEQVKPRLRLVK